MYSVDPVLVRLRSCVYKLDTPDLRFSSSAGLAVLVRWSYGALARRFPNLLLKHVLPGSDEGWAIVVGMILIVEMGRVKELDLSR